uniref:Uncharacterized protein n=2 Tax=Nicotiana TaxID=4085 RepID=A0A1S3Y2R9_TOBAC|nr:PREDICTED: uncharacterized protein LOC107771604 [Nicotiana tabacum]
MVEMYQSWVRGHHPNLFPANYTENPTTIPPLSQIQLPTAADITPQPSHTLLAKNTTYPAPLATHALVAPPPAIFPRYSNETVFKVPDAQHYAPEPTFKDSDPYSHASHFESPGETAEPAKIVEQDEISRKLKGFKMQKFHLYDGRGDLVAHLKGYCSRIRSVGGKDELLMTYFNESLTGATLEWRTRQDVGLVKGANEPLGEVNDIEIGSGLSNIDVKLSG